MNRQVYMEDKATFFTIKELLRAGRLDEAEKAVLELLDKEPKNCNYKLLLAEVLFKKGGIEKAERLCQEILTHLPNDSYALKLRGKILLNRGTKKALKEAVEIFTYLFRQSQTPVLLYWLLLAYIKAKRPKAAWELLQSVPFSLQDNIHIRRLKGRILISLGRYEEALTVYELLHKENPEDVWLKKQILLLKKHLKGEDKWEKEIQAIGRLPSAKRDVTLLLTQADMARKKGRMEEAISLYEQVLKIAPDNWEANLNLGFLLVKTEDEVKIDAGIERLKQFFLRDPYDHPVRSALFAALKRRDRLQDLLAILEEALRRHPQKVKIYGWIKRYEKMVEFDNQESESRSQDSEG
ncbi:MAG: tetratricopeptide repeat protein [Candidatus Desulfofervidaceae bacterium]|nr:tetratricopeptide repeat protein [Candidatus Desulfofervidaceae bacterium]